MNRAQLRRRVVWPTLALVLVPVAFVVRVEWTHNFGVVVPGHIYRSGQMSGDDLARVLKTYGIKTVLNLRGPNPGEAWYRAERSVSTAKSATQVDLSLSSCEWMSRTQLRTLIRVLDSCEYPILIHCEHGSERTSLVSAFSELLRPGATLHDAERQFTLRHLFLRLNDGKVMAEHLDQYEAWLRAQGRAHSEARFRQWAGEGFTPHWPTREMWPYDPKPLVVVTRPAADEQALPLAGSAPGIERR
jgi:protein tyrosine phosphatase (PTP) superfamily phosphohydrolase (DUF442 family)